ncbi:BnaC02g45500D [Brassica napus]|uniref:BnaC02g45500D protein n=1 Tax=Brassica napus TaxID=3708 RepID=A0A078ISN2_BRANA|nr:BnaC02g45500D [Brassica napus]
MSLLEAENMELRARVSELEGNQNVAPHTQTPVFPTNVTQQRSSGTPLSPMSQQPETPSLQTQEFSPNLPREVYAQDITPVSPIAPQSIETPFFTPIQTQQMVTEGTYDSTKPLTEIISATNKEPLTEIISATNKHVSIKTLS